MTETERKELNERLLKASGFHYEKFGGSIEGWPPPNVSRENATWETLTLSHERVVDLTSSVDACIKWIVPKLEGVWNIYHEQNQLYFVEIHSFQKFFYGNDLSLPLAFCLAAIKYFEEVSK